MKNRRKTGCRVDPGQSVTECKPKKRPKIKTHESGIPCDDDNEHGDDHGVCLAERNH